MFWSFWIYLAMNLTLKLFQNKYTIIDLYNKITWITIYYKKYLLIYLFI